MHWKAHAHIICWSAVSDSANAKQIKETTGCLGFLQRRRRQLLWCCPRFITLYVCAAAFLCYVFYVICTGVCFISSTTTVLLPRRKHNAQNKILSSAFYFKCTALVSLSWILHKHIHTARAYSPLMGLIGRERLSAKVRCPHLLSRWANIECSLLGVFRRKKIKRASHAKCIIYE